jgi:CRISPR system Cascade subunit CasC
MRLLEVHVIQTVAPSNLNRDDTGSPKDALFGGHRRARISSQAQKRAARLDFSAGSLLKDEERAIRTKRLVDELLRRLNDASDQEQVRRAIVNALRATGLDVNNEGRTEYLLFLGTRELDGLAALIRNHLETLASLSIEGKKGQKTSDEARRVAEELSAHFARVLDGGKAADIALFGRMLADRPDLNVDAAAQVAHAISTHRVDREFDFYTAVDDLSPREETGAGMMGDVEFYSATLYRYAVVNLDRLVENLQGDLDLARRAALAFFKSFALTLPSGKQNTFAAHNPPLFIACRAGIGAPRNLATAFEKPLRPKDDKSLSTLSVEALERHWEQFDKAFGKLEQEWSAAVDLTESETRSIPRVGTIEELARGLEQALQSLVAR